MKERLPEYLLDRAVQHHCRRGIRSGCDCAWCQHKRDAHARFSLSKFFLRSEGTERRWWIRPISRISYDFSWDAFEHMKNLVRHERKIIAREVRDELKKLEGNVL